MAKTKAKIEKQLRKKTNSELVETIIAAKKNKAWNSIAGILSGPRRKRININLKEIDKEAKEGETIIVPGKVLSDGELKKKIKIAAFSFSEKAMEKLLKSKTEVLSILDEIKKNPGAKGTKVIGK
jgi:large subunit ribosomal protein L18e